MNASIEIHVFVFEVLSILALISVVAAVLVAVGAIRIEFHD